MNRRNRSNTTRNRRKAGAIVGALFLAAAASYLHAAPQHGNWQDGYDHPIRHVLLISIDGMHALESPASASKSGIGQIFWGQGITQLYNAPGLPPNGDPRTPDILVTPHVGVTYSGSTKKLAEHGGFAHDDVNVMMLLSNPNFAAKTVTSPVETAQIPPTILKALGLDPYSLQSIQQEGTQVLPSLPWGNDNR